MEEFWRIPLPLSKNNGRELDSDLGFRRRILDFCL
jgi:hypothetical protein